MAAVNGSANMNSGETQMLICKSSFQWTIHDYSIYSKHQELTSLILNSPIFPSTSNDENKWSLQLNPNYEFTDRYSAMLNLSLISDKPMEVRTLIIKYYIPAKDPQKSYTKKYDLKFPYDKGTEWKELINRNDLLDEAKGLLPNDKLTIVCDVTAFGATFNSMRLALEIPVCDMRERMGHLLDSGLFSDVTLVASKQEIRAHKAILAAGSTVFSAMFMNDMLENQENRVEITDVKAAVIKEMLRFVYTGKSTKLEEMAFDLLAVADKYNLQLLKANCEESMCRNTSIENSADILAHADLYGAGHLKKNTMHFISSHFAEVKETESYTTIVQSNPQVVVELLHNMMHLRVEK